MVTQKTTFLDWDKPVFPSDNLATELDTLIDQIDSDVNLLGGNWGVSDGGTEVLQNPLDLNFGAGLSVTDDLDDTLTVDVSGISESELTFDPATQTELNSHTVDASAHHSRYTDTEAATAAPVQSVNGSVGDVTVSTFSGSHADLTNVGASDHHTRYADSEAVSAVNAETSLSVDVTGDADTVDGKHASEFSLVSETPQYDSYYFNNGDTDGWYRIAVNGDPGGSGSGNRASAMFHVYDEDGGDHRSVIFYASYSYSGDPTINVIDSTRYSSGGLIDKIRLVYNGTYDGAAVEVYIGGGGDGIHVKKYHNEWDNGWDSVNGTAGKVPSGFSTVEFDLVSTDAATGISTSSQNHAWYVNHSGQTYTNGFRIEKNGTDGTGIINFKT